MSYTTGYLVTLKTALVEALRATFTDAYPVPDFANVHCSIEYPIDPQHFPSVWVDYSDTASLRIAGIDHHEFTAAALDGTSRRFTRWRFGGYASFTVVALSSLERDRLYDEMVRILAFTRENDQVPAFRAYIEDNEFIAMNFDFDEIEPRGNAVTPGTPWGTDEFIYEVTLNMELLGEFTSDGSTGLLVSLRELLLLGKAVPGAVDGAPFSYPSGTDFPLGPADLEVIAPSTWH